jgi:hypothetical protein
VFYVTEVHVIVIQSSYLSIVIGILDLIERLCVFLQSTSGIKVFPLSICILDISSCKDGSHSAKLQHCHTSHSIIPVAPFT